MKWANSRYLFQCFYRKLALIIPERRVIITFAVSSVPWLALFMTCVLTCTHCWYQNTGVLTSCFCVPSDPSEQTKSNLRVTSPEDAELGSCKQAPPNGTATSRGDAKGSRTVPRRHTLGGARSTREILAMQPPDMDKKREAFLEHLKHKYPHHASAIMGHQERLREQVSGRRGQVVVIVSDNLNVRLFYSVVCVVIIYYQHIGGWSNDEVYCERVCSYWWN